MVGHPRFAPAARALAPHALAAADEGRSLEAVFKDAGRYMAAMLAIYLHESGGLTLARLKAVCAASGLLSPSRARALLDYLRYLGFIEDGPAPRPGVPAIGRPSAAFAAAWRAHLRAALAAAAILDPAAEALLARWDEPEAYGAFVRLHTEGLLRAAREANPSPALLNVFMHQFAGNQIVGALLTAGDPGAFPATAPMAFSISATARRFGVSRAHVRRLLTAAERAGILRYPGDGTVVLEEGGRAGIERFYAMQLIRLLGAAVRTMGEVAQTSDPSRRGSAA